MINDELIKPAAESCINPCNVCSKPVVCPGKIAINKKPILVILKNDAPVNELIFLFVTEYSLETKINNQKATRIKAKVCSHPYEPCTKSLIVFRIGLDPD